MIIGEFCEQLLDNLDEMSQCFKPYYLPKLNHEEQKI